MAMTGDTDKKARYPKADDGSDRGFYRRNEPIPNQVSMKAFWNDTRDYITRKLLESCVVVTTQEHKKALEDLMEEKRRQEEKKRSCLGCGVRFHGTVKNRLCRACAKEAREMA